MPFYSRSRRHPSAVHFAGLAAGLGSHRVDDGRAALLRCQPLFRSNYKAPRLRVPACRFFLCLTRGRSSTATTACPALPRHLILYREAPPSPPRGRQARSARPGPDRCWGRRSHPAAAAEPDSYNKSRSVDELGDRVAGVAGLR